MARELSRASSTNRQYSDNYAHASAPATEYRIDSFQDERLSQWQLQFKLIFTLTGGVDGDVTKAIEECYARVGSVENRSVIGSLSSIFLLKPRA